MLKCEISTESNNFNLKGTKEEILAEWTFALDYILKAVSKNEEDFENLKITTLVAILKEIKYKEGR